MNDLELKPLTPELVDDILDVYRRCEGFLALGPVPVASREMVLEDLAQSRRTGGTFLGIFAANGELVGVVDYIPSGCDGDDTKACIVLLMVVPAWRSRGVGAAIVARIEASIRTHPEIDEIGLGVQVNNPPALRFWHRQGYVTTGGPALLADSTTVYALKKRISTRSITMDVKSLGYRMDLSFPGFCGEVVDRGDCLVIHTPTNPTFYWGNYLLFPDPPGVGDMERWREVFSREIGCRPGITHEAMGWDSPTGELGEIDAFLEAKFELIQHTVLATDAVIVPTHYRSDLDVRPVVTDEEWETAALCTVSHSDRVTRVNARIRETMRCWRAAADAGEAVWYGAFLDGHCLGGLGIYRTQDLGVIDSVVVHQDYRRQGVARSLVYDSALHAQTSLGVSRLGLAADLGSSAERMYKQLGFHAMERQVGVHRA